MSSEAKMVFQRAELLARVALTKRLNVDVHEFDGGRDTGIDLICTIRDEDIKGFLPFAVMVWGRSTEIVNEHDAATFARPKLKAIKDTTFYLPVIGLLFSMYRDEGYYCWIAKPDRETGKLARINDADFSPLTTKTLDSVIYQVVEWYKKMRKLMVA